MRFGISTSCFYPEETDRALARLLDADVSLVEVFFNTFSELEDDYIAHMGSLLAAHGAAVSQMHPFTSAMEGFFFATDYGPRTEDGLRLYEKYFSVCRALGIPRLVLHGQLAASPYPFEGYCRNYLRLREAGRQYGVEVLQENVVNYQCGTPDKVRRLREQTGGDAGFVLDTKQMRRAGVPLEQMLEAMGDKVRHVHISDSTPQRDCVTPGDGTEDFSALAAHLAAIDYGGDMIVELYRDGFSGIEDLLRGLAFIKREFAGI